MDLMIEVWRKNICLTKRGFSSTNIFTFFAMFIFNQKENKSIEMLFLRAHFKIMCLFNIDPHNTFQKVPCCGRSPGNREDREKIFPVMLDAGFQLLEGHMWDVTKTSVLHTATACLCWSRLLACISLMRHLECIVRAQRESGPKVGFANWIRYNYLTCWCLTKLTLWYSCKL